MRLRFKKDKQKGIIPAVLAVIIALVSIALILLIGTLIFWIHHLVAGLIGGGNQPGGGPNIGCHLEGPGTSKETSSTTKTFSLTAFYHPVPGQTKYELGSYEAELRMEEGGSGASGIKLEKGAIAAPPSYAFGTVIDIAGFGRGVVIDRGCAIQEAGVPSKCPGLANPVTKYDHLDLFMGEGDQGRMAMDQWNGKEAQGTIYYFNFVNNNNINDYVRIVCETIAGTCGQSIIDQAKLYAGIPYYDDSGLHCGPNTLGPNGVKTIDCSGLVSRVYRDLGLFPPGTCFTTEEIRNGSAAALKNLEEIKAEEVRTGDLIFSCCPGHVVIFVSGNVKSKFVVWESGGGGTGKVAQETRYAHDNQRYFRAKNCR